MYEGTPVVIIYNQLIQIMKRLIFSLIFGMLWASSSAQIKPPQQVDTLVITSVQYNYADIRKENWPCEYIYKSTTSFKIGDDEFPIVRVSKSIMSVCFEVTDMAGMKKYPLEYSESSSGDVGIIFSGYIFGCQTMEKHRQVTYRPIISLANRQLRGQIFHPLVGTKEGKVVVTIYVDNYGNVQKAIAGAEGTTIADEELWRAARKAALSAHFNMSSDAPALQTGSITFSSYEEDMNSR